MIMNAMYNYEGTFFYDIKYDLKGNRKMLPNKFIYEPKFIKL